MDEEMMQMAALQQAMGGDMGGGMGEPGVPASGPMAPPGGEGMGLVTIQVPEFALPMIAELLSSLTSNQPVM